jgi:hypothetical protein
MRIMVLIMLAVSGAVAVSAAPDDWIAREKIRAGWIYSSDGADKLALFKQHGMNCLITHAGNADTFTQWAKAAKQANMRLIGVVGASFDGEKAGMRRCVFSNGYESVLPCPLEERYWEEVLTGLAVRLAEEGKRPDEEISGILIDWEMYANSGKGGQIYYTDACYCDHCFGGFLKSKGEADASPQVALKDRLQWLRDHKLFEQYHPYLQQQVRAFAEQMRERVLAANPNFFVGFYPVPHNWHLRGVAQGLGKPDHPMILWATSTYGGGGPRAIADDWREQLLKDDIHCYYSGGMLLRFYSAANLAKNMFEIARKTDGYWLFTVHTVCIPEDEQNGDYYLAAGTPADYLREISRANRELDHFATERDYASELEFLAEPVRYRHVGYDVNRFKPPPLQDHSTGARGQPIALPPLNLTWSNFLMMVLQPGEEPALTLDVNKNTSGDIWGVSYAVLNPDKQIVAEGHMPPGEPFTVKFKAAQAGLHTLVVTAGYYGQATLKTSTVPFALWTGHRYQLAGPGGTLYFSVPEGLAEFKINAQCEWGASQAQLTVLDPDGQKVLEQPTDSYVRSAKLTVPTKAKSGLWALQVERVPNQSFRALSLSFDPALPQAVTLKPEWVFR